MTSNSTLKPSTERLGAVASTTSRRTMKKPDTGSETSWPRIRRPSQLANRLPAWRTALSPADAWPSPT